MSKPRRGGALLPSPHVRAPRADEVTRAPSRTASSVPSGPASRDEKCRAVLGAFGLRPELLGLQTGCWGWAGGPETWAWTDPFLDGSAEVLRGRAVPPSTGHGPRLPADASLRGAQLQKAGQGCWWLGHLPPPPSRCAPGRTLPCWSSQHNEPQCVASSHVAGLPGCERRTLSCGCWAGTLGLSCVGTITVQSAGPQCSQDKKTSEAHRALD